MELIRPMAIGDAALVSSNVPEDDYDAWDSGTTYGQGDRVIDTTTHRVYESVQASNSAHDPVTDDGSWWIDIGSTNRWAMFDGVVNAQTVNADSIEVVIQTTGRQNSLALFNVDADELQIVVTDPVDGEVYDETYSLTSDSGITDWYSWFFEPIERATEFSVIDLPAYTGATIAITLTGAGEVACGECVIGYARSIGDAQYGAGIGITDYSIKTFDDFGNASVVERAFSRRADFAVMVENSFVDQLMKLLAVYRATPIVYRGAAQFRSTLVYGFYRDFRIEIAYPEISICTMEIEGLT